MRRDDEQLSAVEEKIPFPSDADGRALTSPDVPDKQRWLQRSAGKAIATRN